MRSAYKRKASSDRNIVLKTRGKTPEKMAEIVKKLGLGSGECINVTVSMPPAYKEKSMTVTEVHLFRARKPEIFIKFNDENLSVIKDNQSLLFSSGPEKEWSGWFIRSLP